MMVAAMNNSNENHETNSKKSVKFLQRFHPNRLWVLTAIKVDKKGIETKTFNPDDADKAETWIKTHNGKDNLYFSVNEPLGTLNKKANRTDIKAMHYLHVDIDPEAGQDLDMERERCLELLTIKLPQGIPEPTVITFSGGGYQAFWALKEPLVTNGNLELAEKYKRYNQHIEKVFNADNCHNIDRIMRLPYTENIPDAKKRAKGRVRILAKILDFNDTSYDIGQFTKLVEKAPPAQIEHILESTEHAPESLDDLNRWALTPKYKELIREGTLEKEPDKYKSRSEAYFAVTCELVRAGVPPSIIVWVLTNPSFKISAKILEQKDPQGFAEEEIRCALEKVGACRPRIVMEEGRLTQITSAAEHALIKGGIGIYQRGQMLVREAVLDKSTSDDGVKRQAGTFILIEVTKPWLLEKMAISADWLKIRKNDLLPTDPNPKYAGHVLARVGDWNFRPLKGFVNAPTLRQDGSILQTPGYDPASQIIYKPLGVEFPVVPENPTKENAIEALDKILALFADFPFTTEASRSVIIAGTLTALIRRNINTAPLIAIDAPTAGTGKSLLSEVISIIATGNLPAMVSQGKNAEEDEKRLSSMLAAGDPIIVIDNCERSVEGDFLCSMLTQELVQTRILGKSEMIRLPSNCLVLATGNNMVIAGDMARRVLMCRIDARQERPDTRQFTFDPRNKAREMRGELVVAGLTVLRAYHIAGHPEKLDKIGSFEQWNIVREALVWLGQADPAETRNLIMAHDPRKAALAEILNEWYQCFGSEPQTLAEIHDLYYGQKGEDGRYTLLHQMLADLTGSHFFNAQKVGAKLRGHLDRVVAGKMLRYHPDPHGAKWYVVDMEATAQKDMFEG